MEDMSSTSSAPQYAPDDPTLPNPWKGLIDVTNGMLYYWNPETNVTQYEKPPSTTPPVPLGPPRTTLIPPNLSHNPNGSQKQPNQPNQPNQPMFQPTNWSLDQPTQNLQTGIQLQYPYLNQQSYSNSGNQLPQKQSEQPPVPQPQKGQQILQQQAENLPGKQALYQFLGPQSSHQHPRQQLSQQHSGQQYPQQHLGQVYSHSQTGQQVSYQQSAPYMLHQDSSQHGSQVQLQLTSHQKTHAEAQQQPKLQVNQQTGTPSFLHGNQVGYSTYEIQSSGVQTKPVGIPKGQVPLSGVSSLQEQQQMRPLSSSSQQSGISYFQMQQNTDAIQQGQHQVGINLRPTNQMGTGPLGTSNHILSLGSPMGLEYEDGKHRGAGDEFCNNRPKLESGMSMLQPKLAPIPTARNMQETKSGGSHNAQIYSPGPTVTFNMQPIPIRSSPRMSTSSDLGNLSAVDAYRRQHEVTVMGENIPAPFMTYETTGFPPEILREMHFAGFMSPTPIQAQTWPIALQGRDIVAIAKTGSGKTLGYLIPAFLHLRRCRNNRQIGPTALVIAPTRELATQIQDEAVKFGRSSGVSSTCLYGGAPKGPQLREIERGTDIVIATPGRLNDILEMGKINLRQVSFLMLDEADRMLDMGFEPQIRKIVNEIPRQRQIVMFTATWPKEVIKIAGDLLVSPVQVNIGSINELAANKAITQYVEVVLPTDKERRLEQILRSQERGSKIIIFCSTKRLCDQLARGIGRNFGATVIHGDKSQSERDWALNQFRSGKFPILVATDVAARGLDVKDIRVVINYDFPTGIEDYVHRIGRTGRAGATGASYTFLSDHDWKFAGDLIKVLEGANQRVPSEVREMAERGAPALSKFRGGPNHLESYSGHGGSTRDDGGHSGTMQDGGGGRIGGMRDGGGRGFGMRDGGGGRGFEMRDNGGGRGFEMRDGSRGRGFDMRDGGRGRGFDMRDGGRGRGFDMRDGGRGRGFDMRDGGRGRGFDMRDGGRGRGFDMRDGGRGRGFGMRDNGGGFGGRGGRSNFSGGRFGRGPGGYGRGNGRYGQIEGRGGRFDYSHRPTLGVRNSHRSYSRSPDRGRSWSRNRSCSWSRSRSRSRSYSRSYSRSRSRSRSWSFDRYNGRNRNASRVSGFDVPPPTTSAITVPQSVAPPCAAATDTSNLLEVSATMPGEGVTSPPPAAPSDSCPQEEASQG